MSSDTIVAYSCPYSALIFAKFMDIKKTWVACTRLSHCQALETALSQDKQPVGPRREIYTPCPCVGQMI